MLYEFLISNRNELISRCRLKVAQRTHQQVSEEELGYGIPMFLDQLIKTLRVEQTSEPMESRKVSGTAGGENSDRSEMGESATMHGRDLLKRGFTVEQVVHDYGDLCQAITDLAFESNDTIDTDEFRTLNRCLDNAIADAVTEFNYQRDFDVAAIQTQAVNERLGFLAHELRNFINNAMLAVSAIKAGNVGLSGATGAVLDRSLVGMRALIDRSLAEVRLTAGDTVQHRLYSLADVIAEVKLSGTLEAAIHETEFTVSDVDPTLAVDVDRDMLSAAIGNLLQNAFKFTKRGSGVVLNIHAAADSILIDVQDSCGGLPASDAESLFKSFAQSGEDRTGLGLGLSISRRNVEANGGTLSVRDLPGRGCVFTINLPRRSLPLAPPVPIEPIVSNELVN